MSLGCSGSGAGDRDRGAQRAADTATTDDKGRPPSEAWFRLISNDNISFYLDTVRIETAGDTSLVWVRADFARTMPQMESTSGPFNRTDIQERVNCTTRRASDVQVRLFDSTSRQVGDSTFAGTEWLLFEEHPLSANAFQPICDYLKKRDGA